MGVEGRFEVEAQLGGEGWFEVVKSCAAPLFVVDIINPTLTLSCFGLSDVPFMSLLGHGEGFSSKNRRIRGFSGRGCARASIRGHFSMRPIVTCRGMRAKALARFLHSYIRIFRRFGIRSSRGSHHIIIGWHDALTVRPATQRGRFYNEPS